MQTVHAIPTEDGTVRLVGARQTADVFCDRHYFIDTHLLARAEARNWRRHLTALEASGRFEHFITQLVKETSATLRPPLTFTYYLTLEHLNIRATAPKDEYETLFRNWIDEAERFAGDVMDRPDGSIGTLDLTPLEKGRG